MIRELGLGQMLKGRAPNISLNTSGSGSTTLGLWSLRIIASIGVVLQTGVLAFHAIITYYLRWGKNEFGVSRYSYPTTTVGTLLLACGMFVCAYVIEASTFEETRTVPLRSQIAWIQRGQRVNDQNFRSYAIYAAKTQQKVRMSYPAPDDNHRKRLEIWALLGSILSITGRILIP
jgi:hypothetical protein